MDGHQGPRGLNRIPPIGRLTVTQPLIGILCKPRRKFSQNPRRRNEEAGLDANYPERVETLATFRS